MRVVGWVEEPENEEALQEEPEGQVQEEPERKPERRKKTGEPGK